MKIHLKHMLGLVALACVLLSLPAVWVQSRPRPSAGHLRWERFYRGGTIADVKPLPGQDSLIVSLDSGRIELLSWATGQTQFTFCASPTAPGAGPCRIAVSPDGSALALLDRNQGTLELRTLPEWEGTLQYSWGPVPSRWEHGDLVAFSRSGEYLAAGRGSTVVVFDRSSGQQVSQVYGSYPMALAFGAGETLLLTGVGTHVWNASQGRLLAELDLFNVYPTSVAVAENGKDCIVNNDANGVTLVDMRTYRTRRINSIPAARGPLALSPDGRTLAVSAGEGRIQLWNLQTERLRCSLDCPGIMTSLEFSPDGRMLAAGARQGGARVLAWNLEKVTAPRYVELRDRVWFFWAAALVVCLAWLAHCMKRPTPQQVVVGPAMPATSVSRIFRSRSAGFWE